ncbi:hypothetical protein HY251_07475 [bacterium]|nr:hypothetical protein [bacterium]
MRVQRLALSLTFVNLGLLIFLVAAAARLRTAVAEDALPVLRGRGLEIVDEKGRVRASLKLYPADPKVTLPNGKTLPETVFLKMSDENGRPSIKLGVSVHGAGLGLGGSSDPTYAILQADGDTALLKLTSKDGKEQLLKQAP